MAENDKTKKQINESKYISRDISWLKFNYRVLDQAGHLDRILLERLKFLAITASNLDEFFMIRVGSLYNYIDYGKERTDYSGLRELTYKKVLFQEAHKFSNDQTDYYLHKLKPLFEDTGFVIGKMDDLSEKDLEKVKEYFKKTIFPMLTPMVYDNYHTFPVLVNLILVLGVVTQVTSGKTTQKKLSFIQIPQNIPRFYELIQDDKIIFIPVEDIIKKYIHKLFRNVEIVSINLFRLTRNGDFTLEESDDIEANFLEELQRKLKTRRTGRVVRIEIDENPNKWLKKILKDRWELDEDNFFYVTKENIFDYARFWKIIGNRHLKDQLPKQQTQVKPITYPDDGSTNIFEILKKKDILLHHPYNHMEPLLDLIEKAAEDPKVLSIKLTLYRVAEESRVTNALLKAAENGIHVSVLFEVKARFDEENNLREAKKLQEAGCFVIYGISNLKTHTKLLLIVRKEGEKVTRYVHMSSGNYNEITSRIYTDLGLLTTNEQYAHDVSEFFNAITGHSEPRIYQNLITAPRDMRNQLKDLIRIEKENAIKGLPGGIVIKINSLQDKHVINELYEASLAGVPIKLIIRGVCCLRPGRPGLSENIEVISIVGEYLEHSRIYYFHNNGDPLVYCGSADVMERSFDRRIESLFCVLDPLLKKQCINILHYNLRDNVNTYVLNEDGTYSLKLDPANEPFNIHKEFYKVRLEEVENVKLFW